MIIITKCDKYECLDRILTSLIDLFCLQREVKKLALLLPIHPSIHNDYAADDNDDDDGVDEHTKNK